MTWQATRPRDRREPAPIVGDIVHLQERLDRLRRRAGLPPMTDLAGEVPDDAAAFAERREELDAERLERLRQSWVRISPPRFAGAAFDRIDQRDAIIDRLAEWLDNPTTNLLLAGPVGTGKTYAAVALAREQHMAGRTVAFCPLVTLLDALRPDGGGHLAQFVRPDVLVLDDLGSERSTDWTTERLFAIVDERWRQKRPIVATTNLAPDRLRRVLGDRTYDRLAHDARALAFDGGSRRRRLVGTRAS